MLGSTDNIPLPQPPGQDGGSAAGHRQSQSIYFILEYSRSVGIISPLRTEEGDPSHPISLGRYGPTGRTRVEGFWHSLLHGHVKSFDSGKWLNIAGAMCFSSNLATTH